MLIAESALVGISALSLKMEQSVPGGEQAR